MLPRLVSLLVKALESFTEPQPVPGQLLRAPRNAFKGEPTKKWELPTLTLHSTAQLFHPAVPRKVCSSVPKAKWAVAAAVWLLFSPSIAISKFLWEWEDFCRVISFWQYSNTANQMNYKTSEGIIQVSVGSCILIHFQCSKKILKVSFLSQIFFYSEETGSLQCTLKYTERNL